jgi:uncharacterized Zn finger protein
MTRESAEDKGARLLVEGRLVVTAAGPGHFAAVVRGSGELHDVTFGRDGWCCTCPARSTCSHLYAAQLIAAPTAARLIDPRRTP